MRAQFHEQILNNMDSLCSWYDAQKKDLFLPFYSSYDIRDASFKVANVDANIYPAGFNNICQTDKDNAPELVQDYFNKHYPQARKILLITEDHFKNLFYWENIYAIHDLLLKAGYEVVVGLPALEAGSGPVIMESYQGHKVTVSPVISQDGLLKTAEFEPDVVVSNNDFTKLYPQWGEIAATKMTPSMELGWYKRRKSIYFDHYNTVAKEFSAILDVDPWLFTVKTELFSEFNVGSDDRKKALADKVDSVLADLSVDYEKHNIDQKPYVFIKNNSGTYGLGVTRVNSGEDVLRWTYDARKKMKAQKGGGQFTEVIIQEGVPSVVKSDEATAEPTIYMVGEKLAGGFLRAHADKDDRESLNSPGAVYKKLCLSDLKIKAQGCPLENVYGWVAKMGLLAIGRETKSYNIIYNGYSKKM